MTERTGGSRSGMPDTTTPPVRRVRVEPDVPAYDAIVARLNARLPDVVVDTVVERGELTIYVGPDRLRDVARLLRDDPDLRFEVLAGISGVDYPTTEKRLHAVYHLLSMTHRRRVRVEVAVSVDDPHVPSVVEVWPTADWHEREAWDFFGIVFDGHP
ncbi:MAG: NADH-quinone oxidoreductase subunit C, partial [Frankia sp.]|nr:NADH-quinone oxidoreductase subunit C [Frankia sp.]